MHNCKHKINSRSALKLAFLLCLLFSACKEKYVAAIKDVNPNYLVIDGFINTGADSTIFKLSRTFKLESKAVVAPEKAAIVAVESDAGASYLLPELPAKPGTYAVPALNLDQTKKYRVRIRTKDNKEYLSEFTESKVSPPVTLTYDFRHGNLNIYSNTQDATNNSRYYSYSYIETWQYRAPQQSMLKVENHKLVERKYPQDDIYNCFHTLGSTNISIASTTSLAEDHLADNLIVDLLPSSPKVRIEYSVLVKQNVLTREGFDFFETLKKNSEKVGSIFDAQPSLLYGNVHCTTSPTEVVIGFVCAGTTSQKRITLISNNFPFDFVGPLVDQYCIDHMDTVKTKIQNDKLLQFISAYPEPEYIPIDITPPDPISYTRFTRFPECADCRVQGGTNIMPPYWIH